MCVDVIAWLEQIRKLDELINAKLAERQQLWALATKTTTRTSGQPGAGGVSDPVGSATAKLIDLIKEIDDLTDQYIDRRREVLEVLEKLPSKEYAALHRYYVKYMPWEKVAEDMGCSERQVYRYRDSGLSILQDIVRCHCMS